MNIIDMILGANQSNLTNTKTTLNLFWEAPSSGFVRETLDTTKLKDGEKVVVNYDGQTYERNLTKDGKQFWCGNKHLSSNSVEDTGEPFYFYVTGNVQYVKYRDGSPDTEIEMYRITETKTIDPKYIPGAVIPVVELSTPLLYENGFLAALNESESSSIESVGNRPFYLIVTITTLNFNGRTYGVICNHTSERDVDGQLEYMYSGTLVFEGKVMPLMIFKEEGVWNAVLVME